MKSKLRRLKRTPENTASVARLASEGKGADEIAKWRLVGAEVA